MPRFVVRRAAVLAVGNISTIVEGAAASDGSGFEGGVARVVPASDSASPAERVESTTLPAALQAANLGGLQVAFLKIDVEVRRR